MFVGRQLVAPAGWGSFRKNKRYYFAGDRSDGGVLIIWFAKHKKVWRVHFVILTRDEFEAALTATPPKLAVAEKQFNFPEWLEEVDDVDFEELELQRVGGSGTARAQVQKRLMRIGPALEMQQDVLDSEDPLKLVASTAYDGDKSKHPHRLQTWFFAFVLHGGNQWALKQPTHRNGTWSRAAGDKVNTKFGRTSQSGSCFGWSYVVMRKQIIDAYDAVAQPGWPMLKVHRHALKQEFGCESIKNDEGHATWVHPRNKPFPSYGQFRRVVLEARGKEVPTTLYGFARMRAEARVEEGTFVHAYANALSRFEVDAYVLPDRPKSLFSDKPLPPLVVARAVDVKTGAVVGVGFALKSECSDLYRAMLFSMAVPKVYIERMHGIPEGQLNWMMHGLGPGYFTDRGVPASRKIDQDLAEKFPLRNLAPTGQGQSKAVVESTHPHEVRNDEPIYVLSDLNVMQMAQRELRRAAAVNHTKNISNRLSDQEVVDFRKESRLPTPHHYWQYLEARLRTCARAMSLHAAVRQFWRQLSLSIDRYGVKYRHRHYTSADFRGLPEVEQLMGTKIKVSCYVLSMSLRYIFVSINGELYELEATLSDKDAGPVMLSELQEVAEDRAVLESQHRISAQAEWSKVESDFAASTGKAWDAGTRLRGSPDAPAGLVAQESRITGAIGRR